jgi:hypothetical protein
MDKIQNNSPREIQSVSKCQESYTGLKQKWGSFCGVMWHKREAGNSFPFSVEVMNAYSSTFTLPSIFMAQEQPYPLIFPMHVV